MGMERWDPFREMMTLRDAMDRLFQQSVVRPGGNLLAGVTGAGTAPMDVVERDDAFVVRIYAPGVRPEDVEVTVLGDTLTIRGNSQAEELGENERWIVRERREGTWERSVTLPASVDPDSAEARYENGVLVLKLPKSVRAQPRRIQVQGIGSGTSQQMGSAVGSTTSGSPGSVLPGGEPKGGSDHTAGGDRVTEESQESFPASDPPSWTPSTH